MEKLLKISINNNKISPSTYYKLISVCIMKHIYTDTDNSLSRSINSKILLYLKTILYILHYNGVLSLTLKVFNFEKIKCLTTTST